MFVRKNFYLDLGITLETRLTTGYSSPTMGLYYLGDWTCDTLLQFIMNNGLSSNSPGQPYSHLSMYCSIDGSTFYVAESCLLSDVPHGILTIALKQSRIKFKLPPMPIAEKFHIKFLFNKNCPDSECISFGKFLEKNLLPSQYEFTLALIHDQLSFYEPGFDSSLLMANRSKIPKPLFTIKSLDTMNVSKDGTQSVFLLKHTPPIGPVSKKNNKKTLAKVHCPTGLYITFSLDGLSSKSLDLWYSRLNLSKCLRLLDPVQDRSVENSAWSLFGGSLYSSISLSDSVSLHSEISADTSLRKKSSVLDDVISMLSMT